PVAEAQHGAEEGAAVAADDDGKRAPVESALDLGGELDEVRAERAAVANARARVGVGRVRPSCEPREVRRAQLRREARLVKGFGRAPGSRLDARLRWTEPEVVGKKDEVERASRCPARDEGQGGRSGQKTPAGGRHAPSC